MFPILYEQITVGVVPQHHGLGVLSDCLSYTVEREANVYELTMVYPITGIHANELAERRIIKAKANFTDDPQLFRIERISGTMQGKFTVYARHISYDLSGYEIMSGTAGSAVAACTLLQSAAAGYTITTDKTVSAPFKIDKPSSVRSWFAGKKGSFLDVFGKADIMYDNFNIRFLLHGGQDRGITIRYGKNLLELSQEKACANMYTHVVAFYQDDETTVTGNKVATGLTLDAPRTLILDCSDNYESAPTVQNLTDRATAYINDNNLTTPTNNIKLDFVQSGDLTGRVDIFDTVNIYYEALGITRTQVKCIRTKWDGLKERYIETEFGDAKASITDTITSISKEVAEKPSTTAMENAINAATSLITGNSGGYVVMHDTNNDGEPDEILIMDSPDISTAVKVIRMNKNGVGLSTTGYSGNYTTAFTAQGIVADAITTGTLNADLIKAGVIEDVARNSQIDMTTGVASLYQLLAKAFCKIVDATTLDVLASLTAGAQGGNLQLYDRNGELLAYLQASASGGNFVLYDTSGNLKVHSFVGGNGDGILDALDSSGNVTVSLVGDTGTVECNNVDTDNVKCNNVKPRNSQWVEVYSGTLTSGYVYFDYDPYNTIVIMAKVTSTSSYNEITIPKCMLIENTDQRFCISDDTDYVVVRVRWFNQNDHNYVTVTIDSRNSSGSVEKIYASYT